MIQIAGRDPERDLYELPSDIARGVRADGMALQDSVDALCELLAGGWVIYAGSW